MNFLKSIISRLKTQRREMHRNGRLKKYLSGGRIPWTTGYEDFKWDRIVESINDERILDLFRERRPLPEKFGVGIDERIVEYPFVISALGKTPARLLDAGSTFNFISVVSHPLISQKELTIFTAYPESSNHVEKRISYEFGDLRNLPFRDNWFDEVACISTLEHIGMDNAIYGYGDETIPSAKNEGSEYLTAVAELIRVLKHKGSLFITVPFGRKINYEYFQQFDSAMVGSMKALLDGAGQTQLTFFKYTSDGWQFSTESECGSAEAFNPHSGRGKGTDGAAHSRAICGIQFTKLT